MAQQAEREHKISQAIARIKTTVLAIVCAIMGGVGLFVMTAWLLIQDGPHVGEHLKLLSNYFVGYSVTWPGALVGLVYGAMTGGVVGWVIGQIYNWIVNARQK